MDLPELQILFNVFINIQPSQEIICITVETLWGTARDANETRSGDWFLFLLLFPGVMENPS